MSIFVLFTMVFGCVGLVLGILVLVFRERVLSFVRRRYESVYREDGLSEDEFRTRLPTMPAVVIIAVGVVVVSAGFVAVGLIAAR